MSEDKYDGCLVDGQHVDYWEPATVSLPVRGTDKKQTTSKCDAVVLSDDRTVFVCTEPGCDFWAEKVEMVTMAHRSKIHADKVAARNKPVRVNWNEFSQFTVGDLAETYAIMRQEVDDLLAKLESHVTKTADMRRQRDEAVKKWNDAQAAFAKLGLKLGGN